MAELLTKERVLELAAKFMAMTEERGASPTEAANAAAMLQSLLHRHQLSMLDVKQADLKKKCPVGEEHFTSAWKEIPDYARILCREICGAFEVRMIYTRMNVGMQMTFVGQELDAAVAKYLYLRVCDELYALATRQGRDFGYSRIQLSDYRASFICAAAIEIGKRLKQEREKEGKAESRMGALIVLKNELVKDYVAENYPDLKSWKTRMSYGDGTDHGTEAGKNIDLSMRGLEGKEKKTKRSEKS